MSFYSIINEAKGSKVYSSKEGTKGKDRAGTLKATKSRVKEYDSIMQALKMGTYGDMFTTDGSSRIYVITKRKWGEDDEQSVGTKVAKGFTPGSATPSADFSSIKKHAVRTRMRYRKDVGKTQASKFGKRIKGK